MSRAEIVAAGVLGALLAVIFESIIEDSFLLGRAMLARHWAA